MSPHHFTFRLTDVKCAPQSCTTHSVVVGEPVGGLLDGGGGGSQAFLFDGDPHWVSEAGPHQLLQLLSLSG